MTSVNAAWYYSVKNATTTTINTDAIIQELDKRDCELFVDAEEYERLLTKVKKVLTIHKSTLYNLKMDSIYADASMYNDLYKWKMVPLMHLANSRLGGVHCTFIVNIRSEKWRTRLADEKETKLRNAVKKSLHSLTTRKFNREFCKKLLQEDGITNATYLDEILNSFADNPLADKVVGDGERSGQAYVPTGPSDDQVVISFYKGETHMMIEATGPWPRVTWLETTMMQAVYSAFLKTTLEEQNISREKWLAHSLMRCALSVEHVNSRPSLTANALMSGRRTGGADLMLLQTLYLAEHLKKFVGTSSPVIAQLVTNPARPVNAIGTHAHELSMVLSALFSRYDQDAAAPISQVLGHFAFAVRHGADLSINNTWPPEGKIPVLSDTLGTPAFIKAAEGVKIMGRPITLMLDKFRQDSGDMKTFKALWDKACAENGCSQPNSFMASEIETPLSLDEAVRAGYTSTGAGGFYGDSMKAHNPAGENISMAVKALRVYRAGARTGFSPMKTGDGSGKLEFDPQLDTHAIGTMRAHVNRLQSTIEGASIQKTFLKALACMTPPEKVYLFFGSFAPFTKGHLKSCERILEHHSKKHSNFRARVIIVPASNEYVDEKLKKETEMQKNIFLKLTNEEIQGYVTVRMKLIRECIVDMPSVEVSDIEILAKKTEGTTVTTYHEFRQKTYGENVVAVLGNDQKRDAAWHQSIANKLFLERHSDEPSATDARFVIKTRDEQGARAILLPAVMRQYMH